ncbi:MAG TPA: patatin-like phospholipase family protein [Tepidisphaeraceae bacterium]|jgi:predicted acylesterase/phospholipase RssA
MTLGPTGIGLNDRAANPAAPQITLFWRPYIETLKLARIGITIAVIACLLLNIDQALECLVALGHDIDRFVPFLKLVLCFGALVGLASMLWYWARTLQYKFLPGGPTNGVRALRRQLPRIIGTIPFIGMAVALGRAHARAGTGWALFVVNAVLAVGFYAFCVLRRRVYLKGRTAPEGLSAESRRVLWGTAIFMALAALLFSADAQLAQYIGPIPVVLSAAAAWVVLCGAMVFWGLERSIPVFWITLAWLILWSLANTNDDHAIRHVPLASGAAPTSRPSPPQLEDTFDRWLANRQDKAAYAGKPYPVVVVATEGGGIYAAYHTAMALADLQDAQPAFGQHVFAISGVSGGSVGASVFAALMSGQTQVTKPSASRTPAASGPMATATRAYFAPDFLAPLIAKAFFPDLFQRFNFFPIPAADRARALEQSLEAAWTGLAKSGGITRPAGNPFDSDFDSLWPDFTSGATPALLLNTTEVETGRQVVISNLGPGRYGRPNLFFADHPTCHIRLSTAVVLSARFPVVTSAGREPTILAKGQPPADRRYVDGGYFENSGMATLSDVVAALVVHRYEKKSPIPFRLVVVRIALDDTDAAAGDKEYADAHPATQPAGPSSTSAAPSTAATAEAREKFSESAFEEIGSPVRALLNTRTAREESALARMHGMVDPPANGCSLIQLLISDTGGPLPLGWLLSEHAKAEIDAQVTEPSRNLDQLAKEITR